MGKVSRADSLVERTGELERLDQLIEATRQGRGGLVLIEGPAGIGKSSLLAAVAEQVRGDAGPGKEVWLATARGNPAEAELGFGIVLQLLSAIVTDRNSRSNELPGLVPSYSVIAPLFDEAALARDADRESEAKSSLAMLHGLYELVRRLCAERPMVMLVDDAQWGDPPSLRLLHFLAQRLSGLALALVVAVRTGEPEGDLNLRAGGARLGTRPLSGVEALTPAELPSPGAHV